MNTTANELNGKLQNIGTAGKDAKTKAQELVSEPVDAISRTTHDLGYNAGKMASDVANKVGGYYQNSTGYVKEHPVKGVAIAAAAGVLAGSVLTMAFKRT